MYKVILLFGICLLCVYAAIAASCDGCYEDANVENEDVVRAATHASRQLSKQFSGKYHHKLAKILKAQAQVVAGMNYKIDLVVGKTNCDKKQVDYENIEDCEFQDGISTYKKCTVVVYRDLKENHKLVSSGCILTSKKDL